jgi:hypothetical protein
VETIFTTVLALCSLAACAAALFAAYRLARPRG